MLQKQTFNIPLGYGVDQSTDKRVLDVPALAVLKDAEFEEQGGLQTRKPTEALGTSVFGGGSLTAADVRRVVAYGNELLLFTKDKLYSWNATSESWVDKGTHLAAKIEEASRFVTTGDQIYCDRAELGGYVLYSWHEVRGGNTYGYVAAIDATTNAVTLAPYELAGFQRIRLVALETKILLVFYDGLTGHYCYALDPADPSAALAGSSTTVIASNAAEFDAVKVPGADQAAIVSKRNGSASYEVTTMTAALVRATATKARTASGSAIACAVDPTGTYIQVIRNVAGSSAIVGDLIAVSGLADVFTNQAIGTTVGGQVSQITCAYRSVQDSGVYRAYVFWHHGGTAANDPNVQQAWVATDNTLGAAELFARRIDINSRAFDRDGRVFVWLGFSTESSFSDGSGALFSFALQNTYYLYRDDAFLCGKAAYQRGGGIGLDGWLPGVQALGDDRYAWCGGERRRITVGGAGQRRDGYAARAPHEIVVEFDSDEARRCVKLGQTLYITGGEVLQFDRVQLTEVGFHTYPHTIALSPGASGAIPDGTYVYKQTARWDNGVGETDRSTTATNIAHVMTGGPKKVELTYIPLYTTHKLDRPIAIETWRTEVNPSQDAPFYRVTDSDPGTVTGDNCYIENEFATDYSSVAIFVDNLTDAEIVANEANTENGSVLENLAPPPATIIAASDERIFLAGIAGDPDRVWYSKRRNDGEVAAFHDGNVFAVPREGGALTGLVVRDGLVYVFRETALYLMPGDGFDNTGGGQNYGPARELSLDVGATSQEAIAVTPTGIVFHSRKGKYRVNGAQLDYIGGPVKDYDDEEVLAVHVVETQHQIRWVTPSRVLVLDYAATTPQNPIGQWGEWTMASGAHACIWGGAYVLLSSSQGALVQQDDYGNDVAYGIDLETPWIKMNDLQGAGRVWRILVLGEHLGGAYKLRVRIARDYEVDEATGQPAWFDDKPWPRAGETVDDQYDVGAGFTAKIGPSIQRCTSIKVRITVVGNDAYAAPAVPAVKLTGIGLEVGIKPNMTRRIPVESKA